MKKLFSSIFTAEHEKYLVHGGMVTKITQAGFCVEQLQALFMDQVKSTSLVDMIRH